VILHAAALHIGIASTLLIIDLKISSPTLQEVEDTGLLGVLKISSPTLQEVEDTGLLGVLLGRYVCHIWCRRRRGCLQLGVRVNL